MLIQEERKGGMNVDALSKESEKEKIRNRYKGICQDKLEMIPAIDQVDILHDDREKRVGVYVRVSTDDPRQTSSFELQRNHYTDLIDRYPNWHLYRIYADACVIIPLRRQTLAAKGLTPV